MMTGYMNTVYIISVILLFPLLSRLFSGLNPAVPTGCTHPVGTNAEPWKPCKSRAEGTFELYPLFAFYMTLYFRDIFHTQSKLYSSRAREMRWVQWVQWVQMFIYSIKSMLIAHFKLYPQMRKTYPMCTHSQTEAEAGAGAMTGTGTEAEAGAESVAGTETMTSPGAGAESGARTKDIPG